MNEKKTTKISLSTFFLIIAIIFIVVMAIFMLIFYNEKVEATKKAESLQAEVNNLQGKIDIILNTINSITVNENNSTNNNSKQFTDAQVKTALSNFLELKAHANCDALLENLTEKGKLNYDSSKNSFDQDDSTEITTIKFSDYKTAMLNYVSENEFEKNWTSAIYMKENDDGYLTKAQGGGSLRVYTIISITKNNDSSYLAKVSFVVDDIDDSTEEYEDLTFTIKSYNNNCVIDSVN